MLPLTLWQSVSNITGDFLIPLSRADLLGENKQMLSDIHHFQMQATIAGAAGMRHSPGHVTAPRLIPIVRFLRMVLRDLSAVQAEPKALVS